MSWMSGTGGLGQSLSHLGSSSPSALDRLTCTHPPAQKESRGTHTQMHTHPPKWVLLPPDHSHTNAHSQTREQHAQLQAAGAP